MGRTDEIAAVCLWACVMFGTALGSRAVAEVREAGIVQVQEPPTIDGRLVEPVWQSVPEFSEFTRPGTDGTDAEATVAWMARTRDWLFVALRCEDADAGKIVCGATGRDRSVHRDESVEVFLSPGTDGASYYHFKVNAGGQQGDNYYTARHGTVKAVAWDGFFRSAVVVQPEGGCWTAEVAIPLFYLAARAGHDAWRVNVCRNNKDEGSGGGMTWSSWSPLSMNRYHRPAEFGTLAGVEALNPRRVFAPVVTGRARRGPFNDIPEQFYRVYVPLRTDGLPGEVHVKVTDVTESGQREEVGKALRVAGPARVELKIPVDTFEQRRTFYELSFEDELGVWRSGAEILPEEDTRPMKAFAERSYFTTESEGGVAVVTRFPPTFIRGASVDITLGGRAYTFTMQGTEALFPVALGALDPGEHPVSVALRKDGHVAAEATCTCVKREPAAVGTEVKLDRWRRCVLVDGEPVLPCGFVGLRIGGKLERSVRQIKALGMNLYIPWGGLQKPEDLAPTVAVLERHGMYGLLPLDHFFPGLTKPTHPEILQRTREHAATWLPQFLDLAGKSPSTLAYLTIDEPGGMEHASGQAVEAVYEAISERDPYHPAQANFCRALRPDVPGDIAMMDIYWEPDDERHNSMMPAVRWFERAHKDATTLDKPLWVVVQSELQTGMVRHMRAAEQRANTYLALVHGATGLVYFRWPVLHKTNMDMFRRLMGEVKTLAPAMLDRPPAQHVTVVEGDSDMIQAAVRQYPGGRFVLLAVNVYHLGGNVGFRVRGVDDGPTVSPLFGGDSLRVEDGWFRDRFEAMQVHVYDLGQADCLAEGSVRLELRVSADAVPAVADANLLPPVGEPEGWSGGGVGRQVTFNGQPSLRLTIDDEEDERVFAYSRPVTLAPDTRYAFSFWAKGEFERAREEWGGPQGLIQPVAGGRALCSLQTHPHLIENWALRSGAFRTGTEPIEVRCLIRGERRKYTGTAWVNTVVLKPAVETGSKNLLPNSGFEVPALPDFPYRWTVRPWAGVPDGGVTGGSDPLVTLDKDRPFEGDNALRLRMGDGLQLSPLIPWHGPFMVALERDKVYTLSMWVRSSEQSLAMKCSWRTPEKNIWREFTVGREWTRVSISGKPFVYRGKGVVGFQLRPDRVTMDFSADSRVWVDALQIEQGATATEYERDVFTLESACRER